ncbi:MAG TPA: hypothetical protein PLZ68_03020, partial [Ferruginibacter sp.]|nr:hypothetical protein [Ferruginibacter sp.]
MGRSSQSGTRTGGRNMPVLNLLWPGCPKLYGIIFVPLQNGFYSNCPGASNALDLNIPLQPEFFLCHAIDHYTFVIK